MGVHRHRHSDNRDWQFIKDQVEKTLDWYREWDEEDQYSPTGDLDLIVALADALATLAECVGIYTLTYGKDTK